MKRAISLMLAVAVACSFMFVGGVAATDDNNNDDDGIEQEIDQEAELEQEANASLEQEQEVAQSNYGLQGGSVAYAEDGNATAGNSLEQSNANYQIGEVEAENEGEIDQEAENEFDVEFNW